MLKAGDGVVFLKHTLSKGQKYQGLGRSVEKRDSDIRMCVCFSLHVLIPCQGCIIQPLRNKTVDKAAVCVGVYVRENTVSVEIVSLAYVGGY